MISCVCVTRGDRLTPLADAIGDFARQTFDDRELVLLHDGDDQRNAAIAGLAAAHRDLVIRVERAKPGPRLGGLRNLAIERAKGEWICQWDDDDRYHPDRLRLQWECAQENNALANYLSDQLHWFRPAGLLYWDDWDREPYPMNVVQGSMLARKDILPAYPDLAAGEDTVHTAAIMRSAAEKGFRISRLKGAGWCYTYTYHGQNVWSARHHAAISELKHLPPERLLPCLPTLRKRLSEYDPPLPPLKVPMGKAAASIP